MGTALTTPDDKLMEVLETSIYPGAKRASIAMVVAYCREADLDPMLKPVHIVPMSVKNAVTGAYEKRDVIMPGIGLYRIQADRTGTMAGISAPEFGPEITRTFKDKNGTAVEVTFPEWCKVTATKVVGNHLVSFVGFEYWVENYATDSNGSTYPNAMWRKRPRGQIAKCAEAQALRRGWPEAGQAPTAEEMEGKSFSHDDEIIVNKPETTEPAEKPPYPDARMDSSMDSWKGLIANGKAAEDIVKMLDARFSLTDAQRKRIRALGKTTTIDAETGEVIEQ